MAISYVGGYAINSSGGSISSISLTSLSGGSNSSPSEGDLVIIAVNNNKAVNTASYPTIDTSGYTTVAQIFSDDTNEVQAVVSYKFMGATPDTSVSFSNLDTARGAVAAVYVWRGVRTSNPFDVTSVSATGIDGSTPDPASITPTSSGTVVLAFGFNAYGNSAFEINAVSSGYSNSLITSGNAGGITPRASLGFGSKSWTSGAEDPGAFSVGGSATSASWGALTMALKEGGIVITADVGAFTYTGINANTLKGFKVIADLGTFTLSGIAAGLMRGFGMVANIGSFTLSGINTSLIIARKIVADLGTYTLTGISTNFTKGYGFIAETGSFILTGINAVLRPSNIWSNISKTVSTWTNNSKNSSTWSNTSKNDGDYINISKTISTWTNESKNIQTWTNPPKS